MDDFAPRYFAVGNNGETRSLSQDERLRLMGVSPPVSAAFDLLTDDDMPADRAAEMAVGAERLGKDPEAFARHLLKLRKAYRGFK